MKKHILTFLTAEWIAESVKPRLNTDGSLLYYGYQ
jgi:hypothetical protein